MKAKIWLALAAIGAAGTVYLTRDDAPRAPDQQLAAHFEQLCIIARNNVDTPEPGIRKFGRYMGAHADSMFGAWGGTLAAIERIPDDSAHDARARLARDRIREPLDACAHDFERFFNAVEEDPEALETLNHGLDRLNRTLEIIGSGQSSSSSSAWSSSWRTRLHGLPGRLIP